MPDIGGGGWSGDPYACDSFTFCQDMVVEGWLPPGYDDKGIGSFTHPCDISSGWCGFRTGSSSGEVYECETAFCQDLVVEGELPPEPEPEINVDCERQPTPDEVNRCISDCAKTGIFVGLVCLATGPGIPACELTNGVMYGACT
ncbi:MAG: hypothetical protein M3297_06455 [Thermoproteota archaeon]|jgi:hypothetical protein|nr:hypothetical protein [Thermoproteota archaeon]